MISFNYFDCMVQVKTKTVRQCVQFYYLWKKVLVDDHKRLRAMRRRREQDYNLRSTRAQPDASTIGNQQVGGLGNLRYYQLLSVLIVDQSKS